MDAGTRSANQAAHGCRCVKLPLNDHLCSRSADLLELVNGVSARYRTASPVKGAVNSRADTPPRTVPARVVFPLAGSNHSTLRGLRVAVRLSVNIPPEGA